MSRTPGINKTRLGLLSIALLGGINFTASAFAVEPLSQAYQLAAADKAGEGKCGEGKCGASGPAKVSKAEGKCGEGKCGDASFARTDADGDGRVSRAELLAVAPGANAEFEAIDADHDGFLSEGEVYQFRKAQFDANGKPFPADLYGKLSQASN
ncbi:HvfA family oxazolone/thioamide-modified RiPP metallophore [Pseudomonas plecoglossicida]|uniref:HvfA family oxazolone/thioamide-modified RiPP metallophore n=1 Tax=Pseudomonas plecoglossicida TaxID=70775 RepID=UPI003D20ADE5